MKPPVFRPLFSWWSFNIVSCRRTWGTVTTSAATWFAPCYLGDAPWGRADEILWRREVLFKGNEQIENSIRNFSPVKGELWWKNMSNPIFYSFILSIYLLFFTWKKPKVGPFGSTRRQSWSYQAWILGFLYDWLTKNPYISPSKIEWDLTNGPLSKLLEILY